MSHSSTRLCLVDAASCLCTRVCVAALRCCLYTMPVSCVHACVHALRAVCCRAPVPEHCPLPTCSCGPSLRFQWAASHASCSCKASTRHVAV